METQSEQDSSISILIVEDEPGTLELLTAIMTMKYPDLPLYTAGNGRTGLEIFRTHLPDIVMTDINMPEMCGAQMAANIRALKPDTQFIVLTGNSGKLVLAEKDERELEFNHRIMKPVIFKELFAAVEQCFDAIAHRT
ncbi:MAG TPA: response regulator [Dongiaceae bacterium]|nr:response regulator [Dongiaceae bacterium]